MQAALCLLLAAIPIESVVDTDAWLRLGGTPVLTVSKVAGLLFFSVFGAWAFRRRASLHADRTFALLGALLTLAAVSAATARVPSAGLAAAVRYASFIATYGALTQLLRDPHLRLAAVWSLVAASGVAALSGLYELLSGHAYVARTPYGDANDVAFVLASVFPLGCWLYPRAARLKPVVALLMAVIGGCIVLSLSRGAIAGLAAAALAYVVVDRSQLRRVGRLAAAALVMTIVLVALNPRQVRVSLAGKERVAWANVTNRVHAWRVAARLAVQHPVLGVGPGNFGVYYAEHWNDEPGLYHLTVAHNAYLDVAADVGLVAAALFVAFLGVTFVRVVALARRRGANSALATAVFTSLVAASIASLVLSTEFMGPIWVTAGFATALWFERGA
jgi:O-antigen ligase